ncbi:helix-turn-helix domain-containing protein [Rodentibacter pneumotropicus]|uniref:Helix-turn-helix domain-containing protein n=1 Tax=Rodentibacter pneumotropicus TaxID=758 RepID=A0A1V3K2H1_9PAST|nr:helix-turn-helix transcriptional regulator [Rodentibacter pneumotropicus]MCQ9121070.1 helix-turn-helix domain-containing protein [Rodentibacter pneumotropicus]MDC2824489.1 helix-turn-helix transcriptional regulator [Rodentibacter pneumotropicus]OOF64498.1 transcriptional regulator [Rodentibacter pneumotropicus]OOF67263.1 transcriptional regulator [Rodentibacter pneumotropicus]TGZ98327.1 helix-turn-helix domain-containing protein [Rodentibacter pneumotropicus]
MVMHDKIRMMREIRQWSQEDMANKMNMSLSGYAKLERGETKLHYDKLVQIAKIFNLNVVDLVDSEKSIVFFMNENSDHNVQTSYYNSSDSMSIEVEKLKLQLSHKDELLAQKEKELETLRKTISLLEKSIK